MPTHALQVSVALAVTLALLGCGQAAPPPKPPAPPVAAPKPPSAPSGASQGGAANPAPVAAPTGGNAAAPAGSAAPTDWKTSGPDDDATRIEVAGLVAPKPASWVWQRPSMQFRTLQYSVPQEGTSTNAAELVVSVFLEGDGGPLEGNIARWAGQFRTPEGSATPKRSERTVNGLQVILVELAGDYMAMGAPGPKKDFMQLGAIVRAPGRNVFLRLVGPKETVEKERGAWDALIAGLAEAK